METIKQLQSWHCAALDGIEQCDSVQLMKLKEKKWVTTNIVQKWNLKSEIYLPQMPSNDSTPSSLYLIL